MPSDITTRWMKNRRYAEINGIRLRPKRHPIDSGQALSVQRGQANTYFLESNDGNQYVLKKFSPGKFTGAKHLTSVNRLLPRHPALESGTKRQILSPNSLSRNNGYHTKAFASWLDNTILMPKIQGLDWSAIIGKLRDESLPLDDLSRLCLCKSLADIVVILENKSIAHRDLSGGNVFIHNKDIKLIDFDSIYHPSLTIPNATTIGSEGYIAPFATDANSTWHSCADRFALTILTIELLILDKNSPANHEGGIFDQEDIYNRAGKTISHAENILQKKYPQALKFFDTAIHSDSFGHCPKPTDWQRFSSDPTREIEIKSTKNISTRPSPEKAMSNDPATDISGCVKGNPAPVYSNRYTSISHSSQAPIQMDKWLGDGMRGTHKNIHKISKFILKKSRKNFSVNDLPNPNNPPLITQWAQMQKSKSRQTPAKKVAMTFSITDLPNPTFKLPKIKPIKTYHLSDTPLEI